MEKAGRGRVLMIGQCREQGLPAPVWTSDEKLGVTVTFRTPEVMKMISVMKGDMARGAIQEKLGLRDAKFFRESYLQAGIRFGVIEMTLFDKPNSRFQKYRLTTKGATMKKRMEKHV